MFEEEIDKLDKNDLADGMFNGHDCYKESETVRSKDRKGLDFEKTNFVQYYLLSMLRGSSVPAIH